MSEHPAIVYESDSVDATVRFGRCLGQRAEPGTVIGLIGPLGTGKTQLVKGIAAGLEVEDARRVCSPTFIIIREHAGRLRLYHVDAYRVSSNDLLAIGFDEICKAGGLVAVEWADRVADILPEDSLTITIEPVGPEGRRLSCRAAGPTSHRLLADLGGPP